MKILVINGPNLNMLGQRESTHYGTETYQSICDSVEGDFPDHHFTFFQSNSEGELITRLHVVSRDTPDGLICNFGGYTHTSVALRDALVLLHCPKVEVHLSNIHNRESFRQTSLTGEVCDGIITGFGVYSYQLGVYALEKLHSNT